MTAFLGPNAAGKSAFFERTAGLLDLREGLIYLDDPTSALDLGR